MSTKEENSSYKQILKSTSIFGGVQALNILITIIRSKFIAVFLGPAGMGVVGLYNSTTGIVSSITGFGLGTSGVKEISANSETNARDKTIDLVKKLALITGLFGTLITILLSPILSKISFGTYEYTFHFAIISITLLFTQIYTCDLTILQGLRKINYLAKANIFGSISGALIAIPLYILWGENGILPVIILSSLVNVFISKYFLNQEIKKSSDITLKQSLIEGKSMLTLGLTLSFSGFINLGCLHVLRLFITHNGSLNDLGLYGAGFNIVNTYVGLIFSAMATDYFPRLSASTDNQNKQNEIINQQAEVAILVLAPILILMMVFIKWFILLLYTTEFISIVDMIYFACIGILFKSTSWAFSFIIISKGQSKVFIIHELIANLYFLILNILGYYFFKLNGLGISFLISYLLYMIHMYLLIKLKYCFELKPKFIKIFLIQLTFTLLTYSIIKLNIGYTLIPTLALAIISILYSFYSVKNIISFKSKLQSILNKKRD